MENTKKNDRLYCVQISHENKVVAWITCNDEKDMREVYSNTEHFSNTSVTGGFLNKKMKFVPISSY